MHQMSRVRSSSRCSTMLSRSSYPTGRRRAMPPRTAQPGLRLGARGRALLALPVGRHDLGLVGRVLERRRGALGRLVVVAAVVLVLAGDGVLELAHPRAELAAEARKALGPKDEQHDHEDDHEL